MVCFQTKNPNLGKFLMTLEWKMLKYFMAIWNIFGTFGIFCDHLVNFALIRYIFSGFGIMYQEKSGNPGVGCIAIFECCTQKQRNAKKTAAAAAGNKLREKVFKDRN
jgi:hypothetical protein